MRRAYQLHRERFALGHWNHHTADPCAVLYAVRGLRGYFHAASEGRVNIQEDCSFTWEAVPGGRHTYLLQEMDHAQMAKEMEELLVRPPARRST